VAARPSNGCPVIRFLRRLAFLCLLLPVLAAGLGLLWYGRETRRDPMPLLERGPATFRVLREERSEAVTQTGEPRVFRALTLEGGLAGRVRFTVSLPRKAWAGRLPVVVILGGAEIGQASLGYVPGHGPNALVAYQYPETERSWFEGSVAARLPELRRAVLDVPAQVEVLLTWVEAQPWADRVSLLGYSFGAMFLPAAQRLAQVHGHALGPTVMAYGGSDVPELLMANLELGPPWFRRLVAEALAASVHALEPAVHLPHLQGEFLFINGQQDVQVPAACALEMQRLAPEPKTVVWLAAGHMNPGEPALLNEIIRLSRAWLIDRSAMEA